MAAFIRKRAPKWVASIALATPFTPSLTVMLCQMMVRSQWIWDQVEWDQVEWDQVMEVRLQ